MRAKFDLHTHTTYSDGNCSHAAIVEAAEEKGLEALAFADHGPWLNVGTPTERLLPMLKDIEIVRGDSDIRILASLEANVTNAKGDLDVGKDFTRRLDIVSVAVHNLESIEVPVDILGLDLFGRAQLARQYLARATNALERQSVDILCHPFYFTVDLVECLPPHDVKEFVKLAAARDVAMEINTKYKVPGDDFLKLCLKEGIKLSIGSDAHKASEVGRIGWALSALRRVGAKAEDLLLHKIIE